MRSSFRKQILNLLSKSHTPCVRVQESTVQGAGNGVFVTKQLNEKIKNHKKKHRHGNDDDDADDIVLCLYPGCYSPGLPKHMTMAGGQDCDSFSLVTMMASDPKSASPSGIPLEDNAYILNLRDDINCSGYIDGMYNVGDEANKNPSACGHLINHASDGKANVKIKSFLWKDIFTGSKSGQESDHDKINKTKKIDKKGDDRIGGNRLRKMFGIPNTLRSDGCAWYYDSFENKVVYFDDDSKSGSRQRDSSLRCGGAAIVLQKTCNEVEVGDELLLDYGLNKPYPPWARDWYT